MSDSIHKTFDICQVKKEENNTEFIIDRI